MSPRSWTGARSSGRMSSPTWEISSTPGTSTTGIPATVRPPKGMTRERFASRMKHYQELVKRSPVGNLASDYHQGSMLRAMDNAYRLLSSKEREAFDLAREPKENVENYNTGRFGLGCLL